MFDAEFFDEARNELFKAPSGTVVYIAEAPSQWTLPGRELSLTRSHFTGDFEGRDAVIREGLKRVTSELTRHGLRPVLIEPAATLDRSEKTTNLVDCSTTLSILKKSCPQSVRLEEAGPDDAVLRHTVENLAQTTKTPFIRVVDRQCPGEICAPTHDGVPIFMDGGHFSAAFTRTLTDRFEKVIP